MSEEDKKQNIKKVTKHNFFFEASLYESLSYSDLEDPNNLLAGDVDAYSAKNNTETTYSVECRWIEELESIFIMGDVPRQKRGFCLVTLKCKRKENDILKFFIYNDQISKLIMKVGQYPSLADLQFAEIDKKYSKVLPVGDLKNLKKAIGLVAHGAGAGSFVYLRRIFENLILETYTGNAGTTNVNETDFKNKRMMDKVEILKEFLPSQLVQMKGVYAILGKGVHELTEEECLRYFAPIKLSIELILDQKIEEAKKHETDAMVKKQLQQIQQEISTDKEYES